MKIRILGENGNFGSFLKELLSSHFDITDSAESIILAIPLLAYEEAAKQNKNKHLINICSVQKPSTDILLKYSQLVTSIHPLFGRRTPADKRNSIFTYSCNSSFGDNWFTPPQEADFILDFSKVSNLYHKDWNGVNFTPESHDRLMEKTHVRAIMAARQLKILTESTNNIGDEFIPHSFRKVRELVKSLDDTPQNTIDAIMANPYI